MDDLQTSSSRHLIEAVMSGDEERVRHFLLDYMMNPLARSLDAGGNKGILLYALRAGNLSILELLLAVGANPNEEYSNLENNSSGSVISLAFLREEAKFAEMLCRYGGRVDIGLFSICKCTSTGDNADDSARRQLTLLFYRYTNFHDRDINGQNILHLCVELEDLEGISIIASRVDADMNVRTTNDGSTALHIAAKILSVACTTALIRHGAKVNLRDEFGYGLLHRVVTCRIPDRLDRQAKMIELLLELGCEVDLASNSNVTALHLASSINAFECVETLLKHGANPSLRDAEGRTPFYRLADETGGRREELQVKALELMIAAGADVNMPNNRGATPLHVLVGRVREEAATLLLNSGALPNAQDEQGLTPLHTLARLPMDYTDRIKQLRLAQILLDANADIGILARDQRTPMLSAVEVRAFGMVRVIIKHMILMKYSSGSTPHQLDRDFLVLNSRWTDYYTLCNNELKAMLQVKIKRNVSLGHFFTARRTRQLLNAVNNELSLVLLDNAFKRKFRIYWGLLRRKYLETLERKTIINKAAKGFGTAMGLHYRDLIIDGILNHLEIADLQKIAIATGTADDDDDDQNQG